MNIQFKDIFLIIILPLIVFFVLFLGLLIVFMIILVKYKEKRFIEKHKDEEWFAVLDEDGKIIGKSPRSICHNGSKLLHPVVHIHIISKKGLLLQKRANNKDIQPGKWDTAIGGHISFGENLQEAIIREAKEELGIDIEFSKLIPFQKYIFESDIEKEYVFSFIYFYDDKIDFQREEIEEVAFFNNKGINELIENNLVTQNFIQEFSFFKKSEFFKFLA